MDVFITPTCYLSHNNTKGRNAEGVKADYMLFFPFTMFVFLFLRFRTCSRAAVEVKNEPILGFKEGSAERKDLLRVGFLAKNNFKMLEVTLCVCY